MREALPEFTIRPVDPWDDEEMAALQANYESATRAEFPEAHVHGLEATVSMLRREPVEQFFTMFGAFGPEGEVLGQSLVTGRLLDNLDSAHVWAWVPPPYGRRGLGTALVAHAEGHLRGLGRSVLQTEAWLGADGRSGYGPFAERLGYALANVQVERRLALPADAALLDRLEADAAPHHRSYRVFVVDGPIPDELQQPFCTLYNHLLTEMPTGDLEVEASRRTPAGLREQDAWILESGRRRLTVLAAAPDDSLAAGTTLTTSPTDDGAQQWFTLVHPEHRGHRLGLAIKVRQVRELTQRHTGYIHTTNAETNAHMVAINDALGFVRHAVEGEFQKRLTP